MKSIILYSSLTGNTKSVAEAMASVSNAVLKVGAATEDCMMETLRPCDCGAHPRLYRIGQQSLLPWQSNEAFFVQCPICEKRTKGYELPDMAILRWNQRELLNKKKRKR